MPRRHAVAALLSLFALAACDNGRVTLAVADAPVDGAEKIFIQFNAVAFERTDGAIERFEFSRPVRVDLLAFQAGAKFTLVNAQEVPTGDYSAVRIEIGATTAAGDSEVILDGGASRELLLVADPDLTAEGSFSLDRGDDIALLLDVDLRKSVLEPETGSEAYRLAPSLRLVRADTVGSIRGQVGASRVSADCRAAVYVWQGRDIVPDDAGSARPLYASALLQADDVAEGFVYTVAFLPPGPYTVAFTCEANLDDPSRDDAVEFATPQNADVEKERVTPINFP